MDYVPEEAGMWYVCGAHLQRVAGQKSDISLAKRAAEEIKRRTALSVQRTATALSETLATKKP